MTEAEWLACEDPARMLREVTEAFPAHRQQMTPLTNDRKLRLFAVACCRQPEVWERLVDDVACPRCDGKGWIHYTSPRKEKVTCEVCGGTGRINRSRLAVEAAERFADGLATEGELATAHRAAYDTVRVDRGNAEVLAAWASAGPVTTDGLPNLAGIVQRQTPLPATQAALLRDIFGNPFQPVESKARKGAISGRGEAKGHGDEPAFHWLSTTVLSLATAIYADKAFDRMPILGDALEEAGCTDAAILEHCRAKVGRTAAEVLWKRTHNAVAGGCCDRFADMMPCDCLEEAAGNIGPHVRGCWVVDFILGK